MNDGRTVIVVGGGATLAGKEIMMLALGHGLRAASYDVKFIASTWSGSGEFLSRLDAGGFKYYRARLGFLSMSLNWKPLVWTLSQLRHWPSLALTYRKIVRAAKPRAVVHTNWHHALLLLPWLDSRRDIYWAHEIVPVNARYSRVFRAIADRVAVVVCVSHAVAESIRKLGVNPAKVLVVHNAAAMDSAATAPQATKPLRLGIAGQIAAWKGHDDLIDAIAALNAPNAVVLKVFGHGDSQYIAELRAKAKRLGVADRIEWRGFLAATNEIYDEIDVCVVPSRFEEPFGLVALEAGLSGRPVIASRIGGLKEIVSDGETGVLVEAGRPDLLSAAIASFIEQPSRIASMGHAARVRCGHEFSYERFVERFAQVIEAA